MSLLSKQLFGLLKLLNSETGHNQIAAGIAAGFVLGMSPLLSLQTALVLILIFFFRIQAGAAFSSAFFFALIRWILDPVFDDLGRQVLEAEALHPTFTTLYNLPLVPLTRFNDSIVMGAGVVTLVLSPLVFWGSRYLVVKYRQTVVAKLKSTKFWRAMQATAFYRWYYAYERFSR